MSQDKPLIIQGDGSLLLEVATSFFAEIRDYLLNFAELVKSPEHIYTYRITNVSLWNAASFKIQAEEILAFLKKYSRYTIPNNIAYQIKDNIGKYGKLKLLRENNMFLLRSDDAIIMHEIRNYKGIQKYLLEDLDANTLVVDGMYRGHIKLELIHLGFPVEDLGGYVEGKPYPFSMLATTKSEHPFFLRDYQKTCVDIFHADGRPEGGAGVVVLPCGAGKTIVGIGAMHRLQTETLILTTSVTACHQWRNEIIDKTDINPDDVGEYNGESKAIKPITIATYKILTYRKNKRSEFKHFNLFFQNKWGLIVYDEVHLLPAPIIRVTSEIQSTRRLGLTATLVREDGLETDVFSLIGPKKFDMPWRELESKQYIAEAVCYDIRIPLADECRMDYVTSTDRGKFRISSENPVKLDIVDTLLTLLRGKNILIIGQYLDQLKSLHDRFGFPIITGKTPQGERDKLYTAFKKGEVTTLIVSKVANFAIDLPDANALIQVSGTFGSRQEEAQRLGRVLRPKEGENKAYFFSVVTSDSKEEEFAHKRQLFLTEQGYFYEIMDKGDVATISLS